VIAVFVPSLMGVGLVISVGIVIADAARRLLPGTAARRLQARHRRTVALVTPLAEAVGRVPPAVPRIQRIKRHRLTYVGVSAVAVALGAYVTVGSTANYLRPGGYVEGNEWLLVLSLVAAAIFVAVAVVAAVVALCYDDLPSWAAVLVGSTPVGALDVSTLQHPPRPRPLRTRMRETVDDAVAWLDHLLDSTRVVVALPTTGNGEVELAALRNHHDEIEAADARVLVVAPPGERHHLAAALSPLIVASDPQQRLLPHLGVETPSADEPEVLLVDIDGRVRWRRDGDPGRPLPVARLWRALRRRPIAVLTPSDVLGPAIALLVAGVVGCLGVLAFFADDALLSWDNPVRNRIRGVDEDTIGRALRRITDLGSRKVLAPLTILVVAGAWTRCRRFAVTFLAALPTALVLELALKAMVDRPRPPLAHGFGASFPSGHVVAAVAFWGLVPPFAYLMTRRRDVWIVSAAVSIAVIALVGVSRVYVGAHWPSDVLAGALIGALFLLVAEWVIHNPAPREHVVECPLHPPRPIRERVTA
jgi:undecaprenyl-diphosphatase